MKIALIALLALSGFAGPIDSGLYSYKSNGTNDVAGMTEHIQKLRTLIEYNDKIEASLNRGLRTQKLIIEKQDSIIQILESVIEKMKKEDSK